MEVIRKHLSDVMHPTLWNCKIAAAAVSFIFERLICSGLIDLCLLSCEQELGPLLREQFVLQVNRYLGLVKSLAKTGFMEDDLPITSTRKEKSGVLAMVCVCL